MPPVEGQSSSIASEQAWVEGNREGPHPSSFAIPGDDPISTVVPSDSNPARPLDRDGGWISDHGPDGVATDMATSEGDQRHAVSAWNALRPSGRMNATMNTIIRSVISLLQVPFMLSLASFLSTEGRVGVRMDGDAADLAVLVGGDARTSAAACTLHRLGDVLLQLLRCLLKGRLQSICLRHDPSLRF